MSVGVQDALELRTYLHDRHLMAYADVLEASGKNLSELLSTSPTELTTEYKMRRGHVARFLDRGSACGVQMPSNLVLPARQVTASHRKKSAGFTTPLVSDFESSVPSTPKVKLPRRFNHVDMSPHNSSFISRMASVDGASRPSSFLAEPGMARTLPFIAFLELIECEVTLLLLDLRFGNIG